MNKKNLTESAIQIFFPVAILAATTLTAIAANNAYTLPLRANDLEPGERYSTGVHTLGVQAEGHDIGAWRHKSDSNWTDLKTDGANKKDPKNWIVYGKPFYAMADGVIIGCWRNAPNNPVVGGRHPQYQKGFIGGGGNSLWILHDDGTKALYAHAIPKTIPSSLCPNNRELFKVKNGKGETDVKNGVRVKAGQLLGRIGNSGNSSGPHLHVHVQKDGKASVMKFDRGMTADFSESKSSLNGPWTPLAGKALPKARILVWPPHTIGNYTWKGTKSQDYQRLFDHMSNSGMMINTVTCKNNGQTYDSNWVPAKGKWVSHFGMTAATAAEKHASYTMNGFTRTSSFTCGSRQVAVWRKL